MATFSNRFEQNERQKRDSAPWGTIILLPAAIAAVCVAAQYDEETSPCRKPIHGEEYIVDLRLFCNIGGYLLIAQAALGCIYGCLADCLRCDISSMKSIAFFLCLPLGCGTLFFYLSWAIIGLCMYSNQMREECKDTPIGTVILAWSVIPFCLFAVTLCCCIPFIVCMGLILQGLISRGNGDQQASAQSEDEAEYLVEAV